MKNKSLYILLAFLAIFGVACASTEANEVAVHYDRGFIEGRGFNQVLPPNTQSAIVGMNDDVFTYYADQRSWIARSNPDGSVPVNDKGEPIADRPAYEFIVGGVRVRADAEYYFTLNQNPDILQAFHEDIGLKTKAWTDDGWEIMLLTYQDSQLERALDTVGQRYNDWRPLRDDEAARKEFNQEVAAEFASNMEEIIGANYFCGRAHAGPGTPCDAIVLNIGQPQPVNGDIVAAVEGEYAANARERSYAAEGDANIAQAKAQQSLIDQLGPDLYVCMRAIEVAREHGHAPPVCLANGGAEPVVPVTGQ